jgi:hypothetical protein
MRRIRMEQATAEQYDWFITELCVIAKNGKHDSGRIATDLDTLHVGVSEFGHRGACVCFMASVVLEWMKLHKPSAIYIVALAFGRSDIYGSEL